MNRRVEVATPTARTDRSVSSAERRALAKAEADAAPGASHVALLTGGNDKHYAVGLASALVGAGVAVDFVASSDLDCPEVRVRGITFLDLRGDQREDVSFGRKVIRILAYYRRLIAYVAVCRPKLLHILWNNKFDLFDRTLLMLYYRVLGKRILFTAHNVNAAKRDSADTWHNRMSLRVQYGLCHRIFAHTDRMKRELIEEFGVPEDKVIVIPYGINVTIPTAGVTQREARGRLGLDADDRVLLFFGQIAPYKGMEYLIEAVTRLAGADERLRLLIAGKVKRGWEPYWPEVQRAIATGGVRERVVEHVRFIPDDQIEQYFAAADALVLPYTYIFQSGVLFLVYSFGLPVIATDVGSLKDYIIEGRTGFVCQPRDPVDLADAIRRFFSSELYRDADVHRAAIHRFADERHSWQTVASLTRTAYAQLG